MEMSGDGRLGVTNLTSVHRCAIRRSAMMMLHPIAVGCCGKGTTCVMDGVAWACP